MKTINDIRNYLLGLAEPGYRDFTKNLIPNIDEKTIIGVRVPLIRKLATKLNEENPELVLSFLNSLPHKYYEENNLHGYLIEKIKDHNIAIDHTERFLPYVDNWSTCDTFAPKAFEKDLNSTYSHALKWIESEDTYTVRYGIGVLMRYFLDDSFTPEVHDHVSGVISDEYYINMMIAWYFATALAKRYDETIPYLKNQILKPWTHNKAIQKALESRRVPIKFKGELRELKIAKR